MYIKYAIPNFILGFWCMGQVATNSGLTTTLDGVNAYYIVFPESYNIYNYISGVYFSMIAIGIE